MVGFGPGACAVAALLLAGCVAPWESSGPAARAQVEDRTGRALPEEEWGAWTAAPGASLVEGEKVLRLDSTEPRPFVVGFGASRFHGAVDPAWSIPILGNVQFAAWHVAGLRSACGPTPDGAWQPTNATGSVRLDVAGSACLAYRVVSIPSPLLDQRYAAGYAVDTDEREDE